MPEAYTPGSETHTRLILNLEMGGTVSWRGLKSIIPGATVLAGDTLVWAQGVEVKQREEAEDLLPRCMESNVPCSYKRQSLTPHMGWAGVFQPASQWPNNGWE